MASLAFIAGAMLSVFSEHRWELIVGRILFGVGVGFGNETVPLFLTEVAPAQLRGAVNILFQLFVTIGILIANLVNYATATMHPNGWRVSLGVAAIPAGMLLIGCFVITDTPQSLIERGKEEQGLAVLKKVRGVEDVEAEYKEMVTACEHAKQVKHPFRNLFKAASVPPLVIAIFMQIFQQFTGINAIMFYAPVLFQTMGFKSDGALLSAVITGLVNVFSTFVSIYAVDKVGRRKLLLQACFQMLISQVAIGSILVTHLKETGSLDKTLAAIVVVLVCTYVISFAWSWGPLGWLIPSETFPIETRTAGFAFAVSTNMLFTSIIAQAFLTMMCKCRPIFSSSSLPGSSPWESSSSSFCPKPRESLSITWKKRSGGNMLCGRNSTRMNDFLQVPPLQSLKFIYKFLLCDFVLNNYCNFLPPYPRMFVNYVPFIHVSRFSAPMELGKIFKMCVV